MHKFRSPKYCCLVGRVISIADQSNGTYLISAMRVLEGRIGGNVIRFPNTFDFIVPIKENPGYSSDSFVNSTIARLNNKSDYSRIERGRLISFVIEIKYGRNDVVLGFDFVDLVSIDLDADVIDCLVEVKNSRKATSTYLPIAAYLKAKDVSVVDHGRFKFRGSEYEMAQVSSFLLRQPICPDELKSRSPQCDYYHAGNTIINLVQEDHEVRLNLFNISLIFDKFYRPVRGLRFNFEYEYGKSVRYFISSNGEIVHLSERECIVESAYSSRSDLQSSESTTVIRLGDKLPIEMVEFLKEPVKGHYLPKKLYTE